MKKAFKWIGRIILVVLILVLCGMGYVLIFLPNVGDAQDMKVVSTPERIEHGRYLANAVAVCMDCHSKRDWTQFSGPITPGTLGQGGELFDQKLGFPGVYYSRNITSYNLGNWTDGEIFRAITTGVNKAGDALFPLMPYHYYGQVDPEDIKDIIAYIRTLPSINKDNPASKSDFPFSIIINTIPHKSSPTRRPDANNTVEYGKYLVTMAGCVECHTKVDDKAQLIAGTEFGGGRAFDLPWGIQRTPNITPHATGIGAWSSEQFVRRFKMYTDSTYKSPVLDSTDNNSIMPWTMYAQMTEADLAAIYAYLKTVKPIDHVVERLTPVKKVALK
jgi:Cytochrome c.